jgi:tetratricopeptide (TPR) repeat protein
LAVRLKLADALLAAGERASAGEEYRAVLRQDQESAAAHYGLGRTLEGAAAAAEFDAALRLFPRYGAAQFARAALYRREAKNAEADALLRNYERDKRAAPPGEDAALDEMKRREVSSTGLLRRAQLLDREGNTAGALALHEEAVRGNAKLAQAWENMISLYARTGQAARAEEAYRKAIALEPNRADAHYNFGVLCAGGERWAEAAQAFTKAMTLDPRNAEAAYNLGAVVERSGDWGRAAALFQKALMIEPAHRAAHFHLGRIYANQRRYEAAAREFEQTLEPVDQRTPTYRYALAAVRARAGRKQAAFALMEQAKAEAARYGQRDLVSSIERDVALLTRGVVAAR